MLRRADGGAAPTTVLAIVVFCACSSSARIIDHDRDAAGGTAGSAPGGTGGGSPDASAGSGATGGAPESGTDTGGGGSGGQAGTSGCPSTMADCDGLSGNGCEVTLASNAAHCGRCGHDCLGGVCNAERCQPVELASSGRTPWLSSPWGVALDSSTVYFTVNAYSQTGNGHLAKVPKAGGAVVDLQAGQSGPLDIALEGQSVFWTNTLMSGGSVMAISKSGGTATPLSSGEARPVGVSTDTQFVYWTSYDSGYVRRGDPATGTFIDLTTGENRPRSALADSAQSGFVYFVAVNEGRIRRVPKNGGDSQPISEVMEAPWALARDPVTTDLYVVRFTALGDVRRISAAPGSTSQPLVPPSSIQSPYYLAVDTTHVYFTTLHRTTGSVVRVPKAGGSPEVLVTDQQSPAGIAVDSTAIYWAESDGGKLWKLAK